MKIGVLGAGSIGCYLGGRLIAAGHDLVLVGRLGAEIAAHGLTLTDYQGQRLVLPPEKVRYRADAAALRDREVVLVTVKSMATAEAAAQLARVLSSPVLVVSFQNGVSNVPTLRAALPACPVAAGMVPFNVLHQAQGHFHNGTSGPLELERTGGAEAELAEALGGAGFGVALHDDMRPVQWTKLLINLNNSLNALAGVPLREQLADRRYRMIMARVVREGLACLKAAGIRPVRIGRLIPRLAPTVLSLPNWLFVRVAAAMVKVDPTARSSMWEDLERRRPTEIEYLNGEVIRLGEQHHVPTPVNRKIRELVRAAEQAQRGSPQMSAPDLWAVVQRSG
ncbi:MAG TPA: 2-dehydropantoate 2-reductase [Polyangia bacterium]|nr:2-dehydropantoate 2-reductase [Polyangia bacterium]